MNMYVFILYEMHKCENSAESMKQNIDTVFFVYLTLIKHQSKKLQ